MHGIWLKACRASGKRSRGLWSAECLEFAGKVQTADDATVSKP